MTRKIMLNFLQHCYFVRFAYFLVRLVGAMMIARGKVLGNWSQMYHSTCKQFHRFLEPHHGRHGQFEQNISDYSGIPKTTFLNFIIS